MVCIDASVFVAASRPEEDGYESSLRFVDSLFTEHVVCPTLANARDSGSGRGVVPPDGEH